MKLLSGQRIGQSGYELALAVFFSFFLHAAVIAGALFLYIAAGPKAFIPPHYEVQLVGLPAELSPAPMEGGAPVSPPLPKEEAKPSKAKARLKAKKAAPRSAKAAAKKNALPEFSQQKPKQAQPEQQKQETASTEQAAASPASAAEKTGAKAEGVAVSSSTQDFKFPPYLAIIRDKIEQNWNPPPGIKGTKATVLFRVLRSGRVGDAELQESSGNFYFDQAAVRAILLSSPFPPMPDAFYKEYAEFSVDLMEKE